MMQNLRSNESASPNPLLRLVLAAPALPIVAHFGPTVLAIPWLTRAATRWATGGRAVGQIALTFDDGPHPQGTPAVLDTLAEFGVKATFFLVGEQVRRYPQLARRIVADGHDIGVHGWNHRKLATEPPQTTKRLIIQAYRTVAETTDTSPLWYRPPYGVATGAALSAAWALGMTPIWWTSHGRDWSDHDPRSIAHRILRTDKSGHPRLDGRDVLLLHDSDSYGAAGSWRTTTLAVARVLAALSRFDQPVGPILDSLSRRDTTCPRPRGASDD